MPPFPFLETQRLVLRELTPDDATALLAMCADGGTMRYLGASPARELHEAQALIEKYALWRSAPAPGVRWAVVSRDSGALMGTCGLFSWKREWRKCATVYELADRFRGRGFMREALDAAFTWGFREMQLHRIEAQIHPDNTPSLRLAERIGFCREGLLREAACWGGRYHDLVTCGLLRSEWQQARR